MPNKLNQAARPATLQKQPSVCVRLGGVISSPSGERWTAGRSGRRALAEHIGDLLRRQH